MAALSLSKNIAYEQPTLKKLKFDTDGEQKEIFRTLATLKRDLDCLYGNFDYVTDPILIDSYIFEIQALHMKYMYYLRLCKEKGISWE